jgi:hypothetical protein
MNFEFLIQIFSDLQFPEILADILADLADIFADLADILTDFADTLSGFADFADFAGIFRFWRKFIHEMNLSVPDGRPGSNYMCVPIVECQTGQLIKEILWDCCQPAKTYQQLSTRPVS